MDKAFEDILRGAGRLMLDWQDPAVYAKGGHADYVTEADFAVQSYLLDKLGKLYPQALFFAEEKKDNQLTDGLTFIIDPIDGTTNYIRGRRCSMISVGAVEHGQPVFGAIFDPYRDEMYSAEVGQGAWCNGQRLHVSQQPYEKSLIGLGSSPYATELADLTGRTVAMLMTHCGDIRRTGSAAMELCDVASGRSDGMMEWVLQPWDYCAGTLLVMEAGGRCGNILGGAVTFQAGIPYMATNAKIYDVLQHDLVQLR